MVKRLVCKVSITDCLQYSRGVILEGPQGRCYVKRDFPASKPLLSLWYWSSFLPATSQSSSGPICRVRFRVRQTCSSMHLAWAHPPTVASVSFHPTLP